MLFAALCSFGLFVSQHFGLIFLFLVNSFFAFCLRWLSPRLFSVFWLCAFESYCFPTHIFLLLPISFYSSLYHLSVVIF